MHSAVGFTAHVPFGLLYADTLWRNEAWRTWLRRKGTRCQTQATGIRTDRSLFLMLSLSCSGLQGLMGLETVMLSCFFTLNWRDCALLAPLALLCPHGLVYVAPYRGSSAAIPRF